MNYELMQFGSMQRIEEFKKLCAKKNFHFSILGILQDELQAEIFKIEVPATQKSTKTIVFLAGQHGNEPAGVYACLQFLKAFKPENYPNLRLILFPIANPTGFVQQKKKNYLGIDLNTLEDLENLPEENQLIFDAVKDEEIYCFHTLHEARWTNGTYLYCFGRNRKQFYEKVLQTAETVIPRTNQQSIFEDRLENGIIWDCHDGSFEDVLFKMGAKFSLCSETPVRFNFESRIACNIAMMHYIAAFSSQADAITPSQTSLFSF